MKTQQRYAQMESKLQEGLAMLSRASNEDSYELGMSLLKLHAALEDQFRLEIASKAPSLRMEVEDPKKTSWNELIRYGKQYLRLSESEARIIVEANRKRQSVAHGGNSEWSRGELIKYADFVERWCTPGRHSTYEARADAVPSAPKPYQPSPLPSTALRNSKRKPWYRSTLFLFLSFFLMPPFWSMSILGDRSQGCLLKALAGTWLAVQVLVAAVILDPASTQVQDTLQWIDGNWSLSLPAWLRIASTPGAAPSLDVTAVANPETPLSSTEKDCRLVWVESDEPLAGKNRSMVWEDVVRTRVEHSGITPRQFYNEVLERNPVLVRDGYEFKEGKTYLLPTCQ